MFSEKTLNKMFNQKVSNINTCLCILNKKITDLFYKYNKKIFIVYTEDLDICYVINNSNITWIINDVRFIVQFENILETNCLKKLNITKLQILYYKIIMSLLNLLLYNENIEILVDPPILMTFIPGAIKRFNKLRFIEANNSQILIGLFNYYNSLNEIIGIYSDIFYNDDKYNKYNYLDNYDNYLDISSFCDFTWINKNLFLKYNIKVYHIILNTEPLFKISLYNPKTKCKIILLGYDYNATYYYTIMGPKLSFINKLLLNNDKDILMKKIKILHNNKIKYDFPPNSPKILQENVIIEKLDFPLTIQAIYKHKLPIKKLILSIKKL